MKLPLHAHKATVANPITIRDAAGTVIAKFDTMGQDNMANAEHLVSLANAFQRLPDLTYLITSHETPKTPAQYQSH